MKPFVLSSDGFQRAKAFIMTHGRPVEQALFSFQFEDGTREQALSQLCRFQNDDGGFGHGLESDIRMPHSSVLATTVGLQILRDIDATDDHDEVQKAIKYLVQQFQPDINAWHNVPETVKDYPHAPWWTFKRAHGLTFSERFQPNSGAEIVAHLWRYKSLVDEDWLHEITRICINSMDDLPESRWMHDTLCLLWIVETPNVPEDYRIAVFDRISSQAPRLVELDSSKWGGYRPKPLTMAPLATSSLSKILSEGVERQLDFEIVRQNEDGGWPLSFSWSGAYAEAEKQAMAEWAGVFTLKMLKTLKSYRRIASLN